MTKEEVKDFVDELLKENPDIARDFVNIIDEAVESAKNEIMLKRVIEIILKAGHILSDKYTLLNRVRLRALSKKIEHAELSNLSETDEIEKAIIESNKII